jgi:glycosyltransferase involved in cell wall biosynthesis
MRVAIVHDYLVNRGGAERVVAAMHRIWPDAPIFTSLYHPAETYADFAGADVRTSALQRFSRDPAAFRRLLPLFPRAFARMDLSGFDVVVSSSAGFAHHVRPAPGACHLVYSYSPPRFLWGEPHELANTAPRWARAILPAVRAYLRRLDRRAAARADAYLAVSGVARDRIRRVYGRDATVVHPPVSVERFAIGGAAEDFWLLVGRLLPHRNAALAVRAFSAAGRRLVVVGDGPSRAELVALAGPSIEFRGAVTDDELVSLYARCRGVVVPGVEDFGLIPLEANASGRPSVSYGVAGARETVIDGSTGMFFDTPEPDALMEAVARAESISWDQATLRAHAESFAEPAFAARLRDAVDVARASLPSEQAGR